MNKVTIHNFNTLADIATRFRSDLKDTPFVLLYAYNGTGKTRLSVEFKDKSKKGRAKVADTLYFNAYTEDLFSWDNDLDNDTKRKLKMNSNSKFFNGFRELALEERIFKYLERYTEFDFKIDYDNWIISFSKGEDENIKVSRGEENIFIWCIFLAVAELAIEEAEAYKWVKNIYIDDPISSLDDNNAIAVATDLATLIKKAKGKIGVVISSHHHLFYNVMFNELKKYKSKNYFLHKKKDGKYALRAIGDTPFFHHIALIGELKSSVESGNIKTYHFNMLRSILEKTASFFGHTDFSRCIEGVEDQVLHERALNLLSHGAYSLYEPVDMGDDTKELFVKVFKIFIDKYDFFLPEILIDNEQQEQ